MGTLQNKNVCGNVLNIYQKIKNVRGKVKIVYQKIKKVTGKVVRIRLIIQNVRGKDGGVDYFSATKSRRHKNTLKYFV